jgi:hypothetical protein
MTLACVMGKQARPFVFSTLSDRKVFGADLPGVPLANDARDGRFAAPPLGSL